MARWWAEFTAPEPDELAYYRQAIELSGQPALDVGCGSGRILVPLLTAGLDVDGVDVSADMLAHATRLAATRGFTPALYTQPMHELDLSRRYRTIYICDSFGIGGNRAHDRRALRRIFEHLLPGGALVLSYEFPYAEDEAGWSRWLPGQRGEDRADWPTTGDRRRVADGDELELIVREHEEDFDPLLQRQVLGVRTRRWRDGVLAEEEEGQLYWNMYFAQELVLMPEVAGFQDIAIEGRYNEKPASPDDGTVVFVARRPA